MAMNAAHRVLDRPAIYRRLARRNRVVGVLRIGVPVLGVLILVGLMSQIYLSSLGARYGVGRIEVTPESVKVEAPEYAGVFDDGSAYRVWAETARALVGSTDQIGLVDAHLSIQRTSGVVMDIDADEAQLNMSSQVVLVEGLAEVRDTTGTAARLINSTFDGATQTLSSQGPVEIDYSNGTSVRAQTMVYDGSAMIWTFTRAVVTLPSTPGQTGPGEDPQ